MVIKIYYLGDTEQQSSSGVLMTNILDGTPSVSSFLGLTKSQKIISGKCDHVVSENTKSQKKPYFSDQRSYISNMELALFKCLFWKANDSFVKLMISISSGVYLQDGLCY